MRWCITKKFYNLRKKLTEELTVIARLITKLCCICYMFFKSSSSLTIPLMWHFSSASHSSLSV